MIDHAQAKIKVMNAVQELCKHVGGTELAQMPRECARLIVNLKAAMDQLKMTNQPNLIGDDDSFHGCG